MRETQLENKTETEVKKILSLIKLKETIESPVIMEYNIHLEHNQNEHSEQTNNILSKYKKNYDLKTNFNNLNASEKDYLGILYLEDILGISPNAINGFLNNKDKESKKVGLTQLGALERKNNYQSFWEGVILAIPNCLTGHEIEDLVNVSYLVEPKILKLNLIDKEGKNSDVLKKIQDNYQKYYNYFIK